MSEICCSHHFRHVLLLYTIFIARCLSLKNYNVLLFLATTNKRSSTTTIKTMTQSVQPLSNGDLHNKLLYTSFTCFYLIWYVRANKAQFNIWLFIVYHLCVLSPIRSLSFSLMQIYIDLTTKSFIWILHLFIAKRSKTLNALNNSTNAYHDYK